MATRREFLKMAGLGTAALAAGPAGVAEAARGPAGAGRPNVIFILADDVGWGDLGCYGSTQIKTPNLDRLAAQGMRFTDAHVSAPVCSASRYSLLTGRYSWRDGVGGVLAPTSPLVISRQRPTLASVMKAAGYATGAVGKWHLGFGEQEPDWNGELKPGPLEVGFDSFFGYPSTNDRVPCVFVQDHRVAGLDPNDPIHISMGQPIGDEPTAKTPGVELKVQPLAGGHAGTVINGISRIGYMTGGKAARWKDEELAETLTGKATAFIEQNRQRPFFLYFATHQVHAPVWPSPRFRGTSKCGLWGDSIQELDWSVGEIMKTLDRMGLAQNTLLIFTSDNGGNIADGYADPAAVASGHKPNGPWRGGKYTLFEGGHREPFIARWPGHVPAGKVSDEMLGTVDMVATFAALVGQPSPADAAMDSVNVLPALLEQKPAKPVRDHLIFGVNANALAIRQGPWKLIAGAPRRPAATQLFNLADDPAETKNVAADHPEVVEKLRGLLERNRKESSPREGQRGNG